MMVSADLEKESGSEFHNLKVFGALYLVWQQIMADVWCAFESVGIGIFYFMQCMSLMRSRVKVSPSRSKQECSRNGHGV